MSFNFKDFDLDGLIEIFNAEFPPHEHGVLVLNPHEYEDLSLSQAQDKIKQELEKINVTNNETPNRHRFSLDDMQETIEKISKILIRSRDDSNPQYLGQIDDATKEKCFLVIPEHPKLGPQNGAKKNTSWAFEHKDEFFDNYHKSVFYHEVGHALVLPELIDRIDIKNENPAMVRYATELAADAYMAIRLLQDGDLDKQAEFLEHFSKERAVENIMANGNMINYSTPLIQDILSQKETIQNLDKESSIKMAVEFAIKHKQPVKEIKLAKESLAKISPQMDALCQNLKHGNFKPETVDDMNTLSQQMVGDFLTSAKDICESSFIPPQAQQKLDTLFKNKPTSFRR